MQSHLIKMYIYHTKYLMFKISSWGKHKWVVLRLLSCKFCCFNYWNRYKITEFMSKIISAKVWLNFAKLSIYTFLNMPKNGTRIHLMKNKLTFIIQLLIMVSKITPILEGLSRIFNNNWFFFARYIENQNSVVSVTI